MRERGESVIVKGGGGLVTKALVGRDELKEERKCGGNSKVRGRDGRG